MTEDIIILSDSGSSAVTSLATLNMKFWDHIPQLEIWTEDTKGKRNKIGPSVLLKGERLKRFYDIVSDLRTKSLKAELAKEQRDAVHKNEM